jgi:hypothetical protein
MSILAVVGVIIIVAIVIALWRIKRPPPPPPSARSLHRHMKSHGCNPRRRTWRVLLPASKGRFALCCIGDVTRLGREYRRNCLKPSRHVSDVVPLRYAAVIQALNIGHCP